MQRYYRTVLKLSRMNEMLLQLFEEVILLDGTAHEFRLLLGDLLPGAAAVAFVGLLEAVSIGKSFAIRRLSVRTTYWPRRTALVISD